MVCGSKHSQSIKTVNKEKNIAMNTVSQRSRIKCLNKIRKRQTHSKTAVLLSQYQHMLTKRQTSDYTVSTIFRVTKGI